MLKVDDVNFVTRAKNVLTHFWVPETSLVTKVCACLKKVAHAYVVICHFLYLKVWVRPPYIRILHLLLGTQSNVTIYVRILYNYLSIFRTTSYLENSHEKHLIK